MELWTREHAQTLIPAVAVMLAVGVILRLTLGNKEEKIRMIPFQIVACIMVALEIGKQAVSLSRGYDLYHLPFHFCSLFIFMVPLMAFYKGKHVQKVRCITAALTASLFLLMLIYPALIYSSGNIQNFFGDFLDMHTVAFHNAAMLEFVLIVALKLHTPQKKGEVKAVVWFILGFCTVSATMAQVLKTNYANYYTCNVPPLEALRLSVQGAVGEIPARILYILIVSAVNVVFVVGAYWVYRFVRQLAAGKQSATVN